jgi:chromate transporter
MGQAVCWSLATATFVAIALLRLPLAWVLLCLGSVATVWAWSRVSQTVVKAAK